MAPINEKLQYPHKIKHWVCRLQPLELKDLQLIRTTDHYLGLFGTRTKDWKLRFEAFYRFLSQANLTLDYQQL